MSRELTILSIILMLAVANQLEHFINFRGWVEERGKEKRKIAILFIKINLN